MLLRRRLLAVATLALVTMPATLAPTAASAEPVKYRLCTFTVGQPTSCDATGYNGEAPVQDANNGLVHMCKIAVGQLQTATCKGGFNGTIILLGKDGKYHSCAVAGGLVGTCTATGFNGQAVIKQ